MDQSKEHDRDEKLDTQRLIQGIQAHVFDIAVNSGPGTAIRLLQRALNRLGADLEEDAVLGPATLAAAESRASDEINRELVEVRLRFDNAIVASDSDEGVFIDGWRKRAMALAWYGFRVGAEGQSL